MQFFKIFLTFLTFTLSINVCNGQLLGKALKNARKKMSKPKLVVTNYDNGTIQSEEYYLADDRHGKCIYYNENGNKTAEYFYKNGYQDSVQRDYHDNGNLYREWYIEVASSQYYGFETQYYRNGNKDHEYFYKNGKFQPNTINFCFIQNLNFHL